MTALGYGLGYDDDDQVHELAAPVVRRLRSTCPGRARPPVPPMP